MFCKRDDFFGLADPSGSLGRFPDIQRPHSENLPAVRNERGFLSAYHVWLLSCLATACRRLGGNGKSKCDCSAPA
jgi:hypothetical protein